MALFDLASGKKTGYVGKVINSEFQHVAKDDYEFYALALTFEIEGEENWHENYSVGKGFQLINPQEIASTKGGKIPMSSMYGRFITKVLSLPGADALVERIKATGKNEFDASIWLGMTFLMEEEHIDFGKNLNSVDKNFPAEIVGFTAAVDLKEQAAEVEGKLKELAKASGSKPEFFSSAMGMTEVKSNPILVDSLGEIWENR